MTPSAQEGHQRFDFAQIGQVEVLPSGALRIPATLGRVGVLEYRRGGQVVRELRPPDEVFRADSVATYSGAFATDLHPPRDKAWITTKNWKDWAVGYVSDGVRQDGNHLRGTLIVHDEKMIGLIQGGERRELSPGYICLKLDETPGKFNAATGDYGPDVAEGQPYDVVQRSIVYNSVGIGPRGWGRQGSEVALRLDGADDDADLGVLRLDGTALGDFLSSRMRQLNKSLADLAAETGILAPKQPEDQPLLRSGPRPNRTYILEAILDGWTDRPSDAQLKALAKALEVDLDELIKLIPDELQKLDGGVTPEPKQESTTMEMIEIRLDGLTVSVPKQAAEIINKAIDERDSKIKALTDAGSESKARLDGLTEQLGAAEMLLEELPGQLRGELAARSKLEDQAHSVLGNDPDGRPVNLDGKSDRKVREMVLAAIAQKAGGTELKLDGEDDTYVRVRFDVAMENFKAPDASAKAREAALGGTSPKVRQDAGNGPDPVAARNAMIEKRSNAWKGQPN